MTRWMVIGLVAAVGAVGCGKNKDQDKGKAGAAPPGTPAASAAAPGTPATAPGAPLTDERFGVASAKITFKVTGMREGTITAWLAEHGKTVAVISDIAKPMAEKTTVVWKDGTATMWSPGGKPFTSTMRPKNVELRLVSTTDTKQLEMAGYVKQADATVAGQTCEVWRADKLNVTLWRWQGIDLKYENGAGTDKIQETLEATEVVTPTEIPPDVLAPPA